MNIHLIRSKELEIEQFLNIVLFLKSFDGPVNFLPNESLYEFEAKDLEWEEIKEEDFYKSKVLHLSNACFYAMPKGRYVASWETLFNSCESYRKSKRINKNELALLLTPVANEKNWFSILDPKNRNNGFIHTDDWKFYVHCDATFPISYLIITLALQHVMFNNLMELSKSWHSRPLGCINDLCENKKDILLGLRTADICTDCMRVLEEKIPIPVLNQMLDILEGVRRRILFTQNFRHNQRISSLVIKKNKTILLKEYGNIEIRLTPLEKTLFLLFINHPEGIMITNLVDHREELKSIYSQVSTTGLLAEINNRIEGLVDVTSNSASEKISKIKAAFDKAIGADLAKHYIIKGENRQVRKIDLDRTLVIKETGKPENMY